MVCRNSRTGMVRDVTVYIAEALFRRPQNCREDVGVVIARVLRFGYGSTTTSFSQRPLLLRECFLSRGPISKTSWNRAMSRLVAFMDWAPFACRSHSMP